jgi:hypothetical protein
VSFYTSLHYYRPGPAPVLSGPDLAAFVRGFDALDLATDAETVGFGVRFGQAIDQDENPAARAEPIMPGGGISVARRPEYDAQESGLRSLSRLAGELEWLDGPIYRARLDLGRVAAPVSARTKRWPSEDNDIPLTLTYWALEVGPILSRDLVHEDGFLVGWIALKMHGHGYLYPWGLRDLVDRAEGAPGIGPLMALCRETWPVEPEEPPAEAVRAREQMGGLWPYDRSDLPMDWCWGVSESG